jgi:hypothetical protein
MGVAAVVTDVLSFIDTGVASVFSLQAGLYYKSSPLSLVYMSYIAVRFCVAFYLFVCWPWSLKSHQGAKLASSAFFLRSG